MSIKHLSSIFNLTIVFLVLSPLIISSTTAQTSQPITYEIQVQNNRFVPNELSIEVGDIVEFVWTIGATGHNVAETDTSTSTEYNGGFRSGSVSSYPFNWTLPLEFTDGNTTLYYICEPHVISDSMRGKIIVGTGEEAGDANKTVIWLSIVIGTVLISAGFVLFLKKSQTKIE